MKARIALTTVLLLLSASSKVWLTHDPVIPPRRQLESFPRAFPGWKMLEQQQIAPPILGVLKLDDYLARTYVQPDGRSADLFIAYYKDQRGGESMHSPKNCLPGWGWDPISNDKIHLQLGAGTVLVNRYVVEKNDRRVLVLYWYQAHGRVVASEYWGKAYLVWDALRYHRRDGALVRLIVPIQDGHGLEQPRLLASDLARKIFPYLSSYIPN